MAKKKKSAPPAKSRSRSTHRAKPSQRAQKAPKKARPGAIRLPPNYRPSEDESFMNPKMSEYFRQKLLRWRDELVHESNNTLQHLQEGGIVEPDIADRATIETNRSLELKTRDRARKLIAKIDAAIERIKEGAYGYCMETHEPISISRLEARPIATLSVEAQERHERMEKTHRDE